MIELQHGNCKIQLVYQDRDVIARKKAMASFLNQKGGKAYETGCNLWKGWYRQIDYHTESDSGVGRNGKKDHDRRL
jgi:hypothetical protein